MGTKVSVTTGSELMTLLGCWKALREGKTVDQVIEMVADWQRGLTAYASVHGQNEEVVACMAAAIDTKRCLRRVSVEARRISKEGRR